MKTTLFEQLPEEDHDEMSLYACMKDLCVHFNHPNAVAYFQSVEARKENSIARRFIESGREWLNQRSEVEVSKMLFAALVIGGNTLIHYRDACKKKPNLTTSNERVVDYLSCYIRNMLHFEDDYASWLSRSFHRLTENSIEILKPLDNKTFFAVRLSTVHDFDYAT